MTIQSTAIWHVRPGGDDANGAGYDSGIAGAGTDYTQQDAAQLSLTDIACSATTTVTSATGGFTSAMIGNAIRITGGGATSGYYFVTACTDTNTITVDRTPGAVTNGTGKVGGAAATCQRVLNNANSAGDKVVAGNIVYIRGSGSDTPGSADYTTASGHITPVSGTSTAWVKVIGENGRPRIHNNGLFLHQSTFLWLENLYIYATAGTNVSYGIVNVISDGHFLNLVIDTNNQASAVGINTGTRGDVIGCEITSGTTSPSSSSGSNAINCGYGNIYDNKIHHMRGGGILDIGAANISFNRIWGCVGDGVSVTATTVIGAIANNTIDGNGGHGINIGSAATLSYDNIRNNIISNHTGSGKFAINVAAGTTAANDKLKRYLDYNAIYNNTGNYNAISGGAHDTVGTDPEFADRVNGDFTIGPPLKGAASPAYLDPGAVQRQERIGAPRTRTLKSLRRR